MAAYVKWGEKMLVVIRGAGDLASGIALRLYRAGLSIVMLDVEVPTAVRRTVAFSEAIRLGKKKVENVTAVRAKDAEDALRIVNKKNIAVLVDPQGTNIAKLHPEVLVDAILAKKNIGTTKDMAPLVIGVGPGFTSGETSTADCHAVIETKRGHYLGRVIYDGSAIPNTGVPGNIGGFTKERVLRAPQDGIFEPVAKIGDLVSKGDIVATVSGIPVKATINGVLRGLLQEGVPVFKGMKSGDIDPRCAPGHCFSASDKARAVGGGVLEALCHFTERLVG